MIDIRKLQDRVDSQYKLVQYHDFLRMQGQDNHWFEEHKTWMNLVSVLTAARAVQKAQHTLDYHINRIGFVE